MPHTAVAPAKIDPELEALRQDWPRLNYFERGDRLQPLSARYSTRQLARFLHGSDKLIRDLMEISRWTSPSCRGDFTGLGRKKLLARSRQRRAALGLSQRFQRRSARRHLRVRLITTFTHWMHREMPPAFWEPFFEEILHLPASRQEYRSQRPTHWTECHIGGDWTAIIAANKPTTPPGQWAWGSLVGYWITWFGRWYPRCMPLPDIRQQVFHRVHKLLRHQISQEWWMD